MKLGHLFAVMACAGLGVAGLAAAPGCTVTTSDQPIDGGIFDDGAVGPTNQACNQCTYSQCVGQYSVCASDPDCLTYYRCLVANPQDTSCQANAGATAQAEYTALYECDLVAECNGCSQYQGCAPTTTCPAPVTTPDSGTNDVDGSTGDDGGTTTVDANIPPAPSACDQCQQTSCSSQYTACASTSSDCYLYNQCVIAATSADALAACDSGHPSGKSAAAALGTCTATSCASPCGLGG